MPNKTLSKEKVNLLISGSVSSAHLDSKHLAYVTQQAIAGDQLVYLMAMHLKQSVMSVGNFKRLSEHLPPQIYCSKRQKSRWISFHE